MDALHATLSALALRVEYVHTRRQPRAAAGEEGERRNSHRHELYEVYRFVAGDADYFIENRMYDMEPGQLFVIRSDEFHNLSVRSPLLYEKVAVRFPRELAQHLSAFGFRLLACFDDRPRGTANKVVPDTETTHQLDDVLQRMEQLFAGAESPEPALRVALLLELLVLVNRAHRATDTESPGRPLASIRLEPVLSFIDAHLSEDLSVRTLAQTFFMSVSTLCKLFRETTGVGVHAYITFRRVERARDALLQGADVGEACIAGGFNDYANFIRTFGKVTGFPPGRFKRMRLDGNSASPEKG
jgi:AraC-like DNA-binding protein